MDRDLDLLIDLLNEQTKLYRELGAVIEDERKCVLAADLCRLETINKEKEGLMVSHKRLEDRRLTLVSKLALHFDMPPGTLKLRQLSEMVPGSFSRRLSDASHHLVNVTRVVAKLNQAYKEVVAHALEITRGSISFLYHAADPHSVYRSTGKMHSQKRYGILMSDRI